LPGTANAVGQYQGREGGSPDQPAHESASRLVVAAEKDEERDREHDREKHAGERHQYEWHRFSLSLLLYFSCPTQQGPGGERGEKDNRDFAKCVDRPEVDQDHVDDVASVSLEVARLREIL